MEINKKFEDKGYVKFLAPAKINRFLKIISKRDDGYHNLQSCFQMIDLCDEIYFKVRDDNQINLQYISKSFDDDLILKNQNIKLATDQAKNKKLNSFLEKNQKLFLMRKFIANPPLRFSNETKTLIKYENWDIIFEEINPDQKVKTIKFKQKNVELVLEFISWK